MSGEAHERHNVIYRISTRFDDCIIFIPRFTQGRSRVTRSGAVSVQRANDYNNTSAYLKCVTPTLHHRSFEI